MAKRLATGLNGIDPRLCDPAGIQTNIVRIDISFTSRNAAQWSTALAQAGIAVSPADSRSLRFVTHRHVGNNEVDQAIAAFTAVFSSH